MNETLFFMPSDTRKRLIAEHEFYIGEAKNRLLSQFEKIEIEAEKAEADYLKEISKNFNPDFHDESEFYDDAFGEGVGFYLSLKEMYETTKFSVAAGIYHEWDKKLRSWMVKEIGHWHSGENLKNCVWKASFEDVMNFLSAFGWSIKEKEYYKKLKMLNLIVNVFKHGEGSSFEHLKRDFPEFFERLNAGRIFFDMVITPN